MEFALIPGPVFPTRAEMTSKQAFDFELALCEKAHASGFEGVCINHHYLVGPEAQCFQPFPLAAHIMTRFPSLYVVTGCFILSYHNPVEVAEQVATLDMISPGKFIFGVGQGYRPKEANAVGIAHEERPGRMIEGIAALRKLWRDGPATFSGKYFNSDNVDIGPRPMNLKGPPILIAADKIASISKVPERGGDFWLSSARHSKPFLREALPAYKEALARAGREFTGIPMQRDICVGKDAQEARAIVEKSFERMMHMQSGWGQPGERYDVPFDQLKHERVTLGSAEEVAEELIAIHREFSAEFMLFRIYTPGMDTTRALEMAEQVGKEVLPIVRREVGPKRSLFADWA